MIWFLYEREGGRVLDSGTRVEAWAWAEDNGHHDPMALIDDIRDRAMHNAEPRAEGRVGNVRIECHR